jgi:hypothetical protein
MHQAESPSRAQWRLRREYLEKEEAAPRRSKTVTSRPAPTRLLHQHPIGIDPIIPTQPGFSFCGHRLSSLSRTKNKTGTPLRSHDWVSSFHKYSTGVRGCDTPGARLREPAQVEDQR